MRPVPHLLAVTFALLAASVTARAETPSSGDDRRLSPAEQREVVLGVAREVAARYVLPEVGQAMSARLQEKLGQGAYSSPTAPADFAEQLQRDLREVGHDRHLFVHYDPQEVKDLRAAGEAGADDPPSGAELEKARRNNFGSRELRILEGNVGYFDLRDFEHPNLSAPKLTAAMAFLADCDAMIVDLRGNGGGWASTTAFLASYFLPAGKGVRFTDFYDRAKDETSQSWTQPHVPGRTLPRIPLFILVSSRTFSAAEEFAYNLKALGRATLVGEKTRGGANNPATVVINDDFALWVPQGRPVNPVTKTNWEGTGVTPDVEAPEKQALDAAHGRALEQLLAAATSESDRFRLRWALDGLEARTRPMKPDLRALQAFAGTYGARRVLFEGGVLYSQPEDRPKQALLPVAQDLFGIDGREDQRLRFVKEGGRVTALVVLTSDGTSRRLARTPDTPPGRR